MKKKILILFIFLIFLATLVFVSLNLEQKKVISVKDFHRLEQEINTEIKVIGNIAEISSDSFTIRDIEFPEDKITYYFEGDSKLENFATGQTILLNGTYNKDYSKIKITDIQEITEENALKHLALYKPSIDITILNYQKNVENICQDTYFQIELKNSSKHTIRYDDIYDETYGYLILYILNDINYPYFYIENFGDLESGGKKIISVEIGNMNEGENFVQFAWGQKSLYDEDIKILNMSEKINLFVEEIECE